MSRTSLVGFLAVLNFSFLSLPLLVSHSPVATLSDRLPAFLIPSPDAARVGRLLLHHDRIGRAWFWMRDANSAGKPVLKVDPKGFPEGCLIEWFSPERSALLVCRDPAGGGKMPSYGAVGYESMRIVQGGRFTPASLQAGIWLGIHPPAAGGVFFRIAPKRVTQDRPFRPAILNGGSWFWQAGVWITGLGLVALLGTRYVATGRFLFGVLALAYVFLLGFLVFEQPYDGMAGQFDDGDDSYYVAYAQNLLMHQRPFVEPVILQGGVGRVEHLHGLPGTSFFLAPAAVAQSWLSGQPVRRQLDFDEVRAMRLLSGFYGFLAMVILFAAMHRMAVSSWNLPLAAFLLWGTSLAKWTYQRCLFTHTIELMVLNLVLLAAVLANQRRLRPRTSGLVIGALVGVLAQVRGEYWFALPLVPFLWAAPSSSSQNHGRLVFALWAGLACLPFLFIYAYAIRHISTGYGTLSGSGSILHSWQSLGELVFWRTLADHVKTLLNSCQQNGSMLFAGWFTLGWLAWKNKPTPFPVAFAVLFSAVFFVLTALFSDPIGFEWQHRYLLKLYPFALAALAIGSCHPRHSRWIRAGLLLFLVHAFIRQFLDFEAHEHLWPAFAFNTAKWVLSDSAILAQGLTPPFFATLQSALVLIAGLWLFTGIRMWRQRPNAKRRTVEGG